MFISKAIIGAFLTGLAVALPGQAASSISLLDPAPMFGLNPANTNVSAFEGVYSNPHVLWSIPHAQVTIDAPALVLDNRGVLYSQNNAPVYAATGQVVPALAGITIGRECVPAIDAAGNLYHWENSRVRAYSATGTSLWASPAVDPSDGTTIKLGYDGTIYAATTGGGYIFAYHPDGTLKWSVTDATMTVGNYPPAIDSVGNTYWSEGHVNGKYVSYDAAGQLRWQMPWSQSWNINPVILGRDGNLYCAENYGSSVQVRSATTGEVLREQPNLYGGIQAISADGTLYSASYHSVVATDRYGVTQWTATVPTDEFIDYLTVDSAGRVYCTTEENQLLAFSPQGIELWSYALPAADAYSLPPVIGADGTLFVQNGNRLMAIAGTVPEPTALIIPLLSIAALRRRR